MLRILHSVPFYDRNAGRCGVIIDEVQGDIFQTYCRYIAFAVHAGQGHDWGFPGQVARRTGWSSLAYAEFNLEESQHYHDERSDKIFVAIAVYFGGKGGWDNTPDTLLSCLNQLVVPDVPIAMILPGRSEGQQYGADPEANKEALQQCEKQIVLYSL